MKIAYISVYRALVNIFSNMFNLLMIFDLNISNLFIIYF